MSHDHNLMLMLLRLTVLSPKACSPLQSAQYYNSDTTSKRSGI